MNNNFWVMSIKREFKGIWIPKSIWLDKNLNVTEKLLYAEIDSYDNNFGCVATNKTLCEDLQISHTTASGVIKSLERKGYLDITYKDYNTHEGRVIRVITPPLEKSGGALEKSYPPLEKSEPSNIFSNTLVNKDTKVSNAELEKPTAANSDNNISERCQNFIMLFNQTKIVNGKKSKYKSNKSLCSALKQRLKVYTPEEIIDVLKKCMKHQFHIDNNFCYVTPEYILREKILEKYINMDLDINDKPKGYVP